MITFAQAPGYGHLWDTATIGSTHVDAPSLAKKTAERGMLHKDVYQRVEAATGVPWWVVAAIHYREADFNFGSYLGNGQSLAHRTTLVPAGRGPFTGPDAFVDGAIDALRLEFKSLGIAVPKVWSIEFALWFVEAFNGQGYFHLNVNSPYVWNWTSLYGGGKYKGDHDFDRSMWDVQGGCAAIWKALIVLDHTIVLTRENAPIILKEPPVTTPATTSTSPVLSAIAALGSMNYAEVEASVKQADKWIGMMTVIPGPVGQAATVIHAEVDPLFEAVLEIGAQTQAGGDPSKIPQMLGALMHQVGNFIHPPSAVPVPPAAPAK